MGKKKIFTSETWADFVAGLTALKAKIDSKSDDGHTHKYAGSSSVGGAAISANKLNTNAGSATQPVYFADGVPVKTTYTLGKSVPSNAVFTDTNTHYTTGITAGASGTITNSATSNPYVKVKDDSTHRGQIQIKGSGATSVSSDANGVITISSTDNNTTYSSLKNPYALTIQGNGTTLTNGVYDGSAAKTVNITPSAIGAMDLTSAQTASGVKTFTNGIVIGNNGVHLSYDAEEGAMRFTFLTAATVEEETDEEI